MPEFKRTPRDREYTCVCARVRDTPPRRPTPGSRHYERMGGPYKNITVPYEPCVPVLARRIGTRETVKTRFRTIPTRRFKLTTQTVSSRRRRRPNSGRLARTAGPRRTSAHSGPYRRFLWVRGARRGVKLSLRRPFIDSPFWPPRAAGLSTMRKNIGPYPRRRTP